MESLIPVAGILILLGCGFLMSENRQAINWRLVLAGLGLQVVLALLIMKVPVTKDAFALLGAGIKKVLDYAVDGAAFVVGEELARGKFIFVVRIGAVITLVCAAMSLFYYWGIMQRILKGLSWCLSKSMGITGPEALSATGAIFVGQVECQLLIRPYMDKLTRSELFCSMAAGMATISGSALVAYTAMGMDPKILIAASIMSAPAGIVMAKMMIPEMNREVLSGNVDFNVPVHGVNAFDAIAHGAMEGAKIAAHVMIMVMVAVAMVAAVNGMLGGVLSQFGITWQIQDFLGVLLWPVAYIMGTPIDECFRVARLMATEIIVNEYVSYDELAKVIKGQASYVLSEKGQLIATMALCGFANLSSIAINIGGLGAMAPERRSEIARMAFRALLAANMATWMTAAIAGALM